MHYIFSYVLRGVFVGNTRNLFEKLKMTHWLTLTNEMEVVVPSISRITALLARVFESISTLALIFNDFNWFLAIFNNYFYFYKHELFGPTTSQRERKRSVCNRKIFSDKWSKPIEIAIGIEVFEKYVKY